MQFTNTDVKLSELEIEQIESELGLSFPKQLRLFYIEFNGGAPEPYVFENDELCISTVVAETLPLQSACGRRTAVESYKRLAIEKGLAPKSFFPFALDGGGDFFWMDCETGRVHFMDSIRYPEIELIDLHLDLDGFWSSLQEE